MIKLTMSSYGKNPPNFVKTALSLKVTDMRTDGQTERPKTRFDLHTCKYAKACTH